MARAEGPNLSNVSLVEPSVLHCRLPLIILEEESHFDFTYNLTVDFREESELMQQIMPHFSSHSIYHYDSVQCDVNVFELIATARAGLPAHPTTHRSGQAGQPVSSLNEKWAPPVSGVPADHSDPMFTNDQLGRKQADEDISRQPRSQLNTVLFAPFTPSKSLARKVRTSVRKPTNRQKSGHQRTTSNPQLVMDTIGIDRGHWNPKPSCSYESTISIDLGSYDD